jgi:hypothetical protein
MTAKTFLPLVGSALAVVAGCKSGNADDVAPAKDAVVVAASADTTGSIGVANWGLSPTSDGAEVTIRGYDSAHGAIVSARLNWAAAQPGQSALDLALTHGDKTAVLRLRFVTDAATGQDRIVYQDAFSGDSDARQIVERLNVDLQNAESAGPSSTLATATLSNGVGDVAPLDLVNDMKCGLGCTWSLVSTAGSAVLTWDTCVGALVVAGETAGCAVVTSPTVAGTAGCIAVGAATTGALGYICNDIGKKTIDRGKSVPDKCTCDD